MTNSKLPRQKPWNFAKKAVYSLASFDSTKDSKVNMNICTYVTPITLSHPKKYLIAIYKETQTLKNVENMKKNSSVVLQLLSQRQTDLINKLGKNSGVEVDKLQKFKLPTHIWRQKLVLSDAICLLDLFDPVLVDNSEDHCLYKFSLNKYHYQNSDRILRYPI